MKTKDFLAFIIALLLPTIMISGCGRSGRTSTSDLQDELQVTCRGNDAVILRSSYFLSRGEIIYLSKKGSQWSLCQTIDLTPHLHGRHICHIDDAARDSNRLAIRSYAYNDKWLAVITIRKAFGRRSSTFRPVILIFKKDDAKWRFYKSFSPKILDLDAEQIEVSHDCLVIETHRSKKKMRTISCYDLCDPQIPLRQEIEYPWEKEEQDLSGGPTFLIHNDQMLMSWPRRLSKEDEIKIYGRIRAKISENIILYDWNGSQWKQTQNLTDCFSREEFIRRRGSPILLDKVQKVDWGRNVLFVYEGLFHKEVSKFVKNDEQRWGLTEQIKGSPSGKTPAFKSGEIGYQTPLSYNYVWRDKERRVGIIKPSSDGKMRVVEPDWLFDDADPETSEKMCSFYKQIARPYFDNSEIVKKNAGERSFYEQTDYIPTIDHSLCNQTLVTSYVFDECYRIGSPLQQANVWAGVNVYEIDPEKGPQRVLALTSRNADELKVVPIDDPEPANLRFPSQESPQE